MALSKILLCRRPSPNMARGLVTHIADERKSFHYDTALAQWEDYRDAFVRHGWTMLDADPADDLPDSVFVEDTLVAFAPRDSNQAILVLTRPGADERKPELTGMRGIASHLKQDYSFLTYKIFEPGTLDGGDVLKDEHSRTVYCGLGGRTNADGIRQLRKILQPHGYVVKAVPMTKALHLKSAATALPDGTVLLHRHFIDDVSVFPSYLEVPEEHGVAVVALDDDTVIMSRDAPRTAEMIRARGYNVVTVDISQFEKLEGCVTCLSIRLRRVPE